MSDMLMEAAIEKRSSDGAANEDDTRRLRQEIILRHDGMCDLMLDQDVCRIDPHKNYNKVFLGTVKDVLFTQWRINDTFSNGEPVASMIDDLQAGLLTAEQITPIDVTFMHGKWWSTSNRRLFVFKHLDIPVRIRLRPWDTEFKGKWQNGEWTRRLTKSLRVAVRQRSDCVFPCSRLIDYEHSSLRLDRPNDTTGLELTKTNALSDCASTDDGEYDVDDYYYDEWEEYDMDSLSVAKKAHRK